MTQHTPGPWRLPRGSVGIFAANGERVGEAAILRPEGIRTGEICANGRLLAAAPTLADLLSACCEYVEKFGEISEAPTDSDCWNVLEDARNLLAQIAEQPLPYPRASDRAVTDLTQTWLLLLPDGSHSLLGRHGPPTDLGLQDALGTLGTLAHQGVGGAWVVRMEGDYHRPRSQLAVHQLATLAAPGVPFNDALALFLQRRAQSNASASTADII